MSKAITPWICVYDYAGNVIEIVRVAFALYLDLAKFHQSRFHISIFRWLDVQGNNAVDLRLRLCWQRDRDRACSIRPLPRSRQISPVALSYLNLPLARCPRQ